MYPGDKSSGVCFAKRSRVCQIHGSGRGRALHLHGKSRQNRGGTKRVDPPYISTGEVSGVVTMKSIDTYILHDSSRIYRRILQVK